MNLTDLRVKRGDPVQPFVEALIRDLPEMMKPCTTSDGVRFVQEATGVNVVVDLEGAAYRPVFGVAVTTGKATVREGRINSVLPTINGVPITGESTDGKKKPVPAPLLKLTAPGADQRSWVCVQVVVDQGTGLPNPEDAKAISVVHVTTLVPPDAFTGLQPLALLQWGGNAVRRVFQITMHNLRHTYAPADASQGRPARHFFWAV